MGQSSTIHKLQESSDKPKLGLAFAIVVILALLMVHSMLAGPFFFLIFGVLAVLMVPAIIWLRREDKKQKRLERESQNPQGAA